MTYPNGNLCSNLGGEGWYDFGYDVDALFRTYGIVDEEEPTIEPPTIEECGGGGLFEVGTEIELFVTATGEGELSYQWYHGEDIVDGATGPTLVLVVSMSTIGRYFCRVSNEGGYVDSDEIAVSMYERRFVGNLFGLVLDEDLI